MASDVTDPPAPLSLEIVGLRKGFREGDTRYQVLDGVDAAVERGERVAILGPSGSGKSTILNLVAGIDVPDEGEVRIAGERISTLSDRDRTIFRRSHIGFVFQAFNLIPTLTVLENLLLPIELKGRVANDDRERAMTLLDEVGLADRADGFPDRLSGGEQQRIAVARALVHQPTLVLADEPTGNLDEDRGERIADLLGRLTGSGGRTLLVVTHSRELAARMDRTLYLSHGKLVSDTP